MAKLRGLDGDWQGLDYPLLPGQTAVVGRRSESDIAIAHSKVSRRHADIRLDRDGQAWLKDHGSANGTFLNGIRVPPNVEQPLGPGDEIQIGPALFRYFANDAKLPDVEIPGHEMLDIIAEGGMSTIYLARQTAMARDVAVKVLNAHYAKRQEFVERFIQEARAAGRLNHPNIIQVHFVGKAGDSTYYFTMEYMRGGSLIARIGERELFSVPVILNAGARVADALAYAHERGIVHRDIKPDNILFSASGDVKLADLGIAKTDDSEEPATGRRRVLGTPHYMSPEQASARPVDSRSDLYSLGATLYHAFTGRPVFEGNDPAEIMRRHVRDTPDPVSMHAAPDTPPEVCRLIDHLLAKNPADRPQTAGEVRDILDAAAYALTPRPSLATFSPVDPRAEPEARTSPGMTVVVERTWYRMAVATGLAVFIAVVAAYVWLNRDEYAVPPPPPNGATPPGPDEPDGSAPAVVVAKPAATETPERRQMRARRFLGIGEFDRAEAEFTSLLADLEAHPAADPELLSTVKRDLRAVGAERKRAAAMDAANAAWTAYLDKRAKEHDRPAELLATLDAVAAGHPTLKDSVAAERKRLEYALASDVARRASDAVDEADQSVRDRNYDKAMERLDRALAEVEDPKARAALTEKRAAAEDKAKKDAAAALAAVKAGSDPVEQWRRWAEYEASTQYAAGLPPLKALADQAGNAIGEQMAALRNEAVALYRKRAFDDAIRLWRQARSRYARTPAEKEAETQLARAEAVARLDAAFVAALGGKGVKPLPEDFPVKELAGRVPGGVSASGLQYAVGAGRRTVPWEQLQKTAMIELYENLLPKDAPERAAIEDYRAALP